MKNQMMGEIYHLKIFFHEQVLQLTTTSYERFLFEQDSGHSD